jgi:hypothetical protein
MTSNGWEAINFWNMALSGALSNFRNQGDWNGHNDGDWNNSGVPVRSQIWIVSNNLITSQIRRIATMHSTAKTWKPNRSAIMIYRFGIFWNFWSWKTKRKTASPWHYKLSNWGLVLEPISDQKKNQPILMPSTLGQTQLRCFRSDKLRGGHQAHPDINPLLALQSPYQHRRVSTDQPLQAVRQARISVFMKVANAKTAVMQVELLCIAAFSHWRRTKQPFPRQTEFISHYHFN